MVTKRKKSKKKVEQNDKSRGRAEVNLKKKKKSQKFPVKTSSPLKALGLSIVPVVTETILLNNGHPLWTDTWTKVRRKQIWLDLDLISLLVMRQNYDQDICIQLGWSFRCNYKHLNSYCSELRPNGTFLKSSFFYLKISFCVVFLKNFSIFS